MISRKLFSEVLLSRHLIKSTGCVASTLLTRNFASAPFKHDGLTITRTTKPGEKPDPSTLIFGHTFTDHMLTANWTEAEGWELPSIRPLENFSLHPASPALHYAIELFEGLKAFYGEDGKVRIFRPDMNCKRLNQSARFACLPPSLGVARATSALFFTLLCPVGPYFSTGTFNPVSLYCDSSFIRSWPGGTGEAKMGSNYGPTIRIQQIAESKQHQQVLWLYGDDQQLTEVGTMNLFVHWVNENGEPEIATPPLNGLILPGVTRDSIIQLAKKWETHKVTERVITLDDIRRALKEKRLKEIFGAGTACVVCPVNCIQYVDEKMDIPTMETGCEIAKRAYKELTDIQFGRTPHDEWVVLVD